MNSVSLQLTDAAYELAELGEFLLALPSVGSPTYEVLGRSVGLDPTAFEFLEMMGAVAARVASLAEYVRTTTDPAVGHRTRNEVTAALDTMAALYAPQCLAMGWHQAKKNCVRERDIATLELFSARVREHKPLRRLSDEERHTLLEKLLDAAEAVEADATIPMWAKVPLIDGLMHLRRNIQHIVFFGHDRAIDGLFTLYHKVTAAEIRLSSTGPALSVSRRKSLSDIFGVIAFGVALFTVPDQVMTAFERYKGWMIEPIQQSPQLTAPPLMLPPPSEVDPKSNAANNGQSIDSSLEISDSAPEARDN